MGRVQILADVFATIRRGRSFLSEMESAQTLLQRGAPVSSLKNFPIRSSQRGIFLRRHDLPDQGKAVKSEQGTISLGGREGRPRRQQGVHLDLDAPPGLFLNRARERSETKCRGASFLSGGFSVSTSLLRKGSRVITRVANSVRGSPRLHEIKGARLYIASRGPSQNSNLKLPIGPWYEAQSRGE